MPKYFFATAITFFISMSHAARIIDFQKDFLRLRSDLPSNNFISLIFPKLKDVILVCQSGDWQDWQRPDAKGRICGNLGWSKDFKSGCESILVQDTSTPENRWSVGFNDKTTCVTEELYFRKYSELNLVDEITYQYEIVLEGQEAFDFCNMLIDGGAEKSNVGNWTVWNLNNLAQCKIQKDQIETLEAKISFK